MVLTLALLFFHYGEATEKQRIRERRSVTCGQQVMLTHMQGASLHSPNYPMFFEDQNQCMWEIRSFDPNSRIKIFFDDWMMPISASGGCDTAYLELRELVSGNIQSSCKLCGQNPGYYITNLDHVQIALQGDHLVGATSIGPKRFALRVELTREPPRVLAVDGSYVVNGVSPLPAQSSQPKTQQPAQQFPPQQYPQQYPPMQQNPQNGQYPPPYAQIPPQPQHPQQAPQPQHPQQSMGQSNGQYPNPMHPAVIKSSNNLHGQTGNTLPASNYGNQQAPPSYMPSQIGPDGRPIAGQIGPDGRPIMGQVGPDGRYYPNAYQRNPYEQYPTYDDLESAETRPEEKAQMDPKSKVAIVLFLIALFVSVIVIMAYITKRRYQKTKEANKSGHQEPRTATPRLDVSGIKQFQNRMKENALVIGERVKVNTIKANDKIREKVTQIRAKANNNNNNPSDV